MLIIKETLPTDLEKILAVETLAFNRCDEADLVKKLLHDQTAKPFLSLLAMRENEAIGHLLFTKAYLENSKDLVSIALLAPLAVIPNYQKQGVGSLLVKEGLKRLHQQNFNLVFVLGYPEYYQRFGFQSAQKLGFFSPFPIPPQHSDAWMVLALTKNILGLVSGTVKCANSLNQPEYWRE
ncbi:MAG: N-acetyltransferase [Gomphosphaeria aponina SAG 52.96 = DSM 107014]|uniref:N-acetyltransferase n=1 Tax=Gomphosphaeria aponina SAG 52.96 = DSM 107014 TaxID=1521640 RepID=A0A941GTB5_9CHRO|nr:N-acetyltransferase [Gomphosphaeria aponina SAG 52.96 = DSM 107014]